MDQCFEGLKGVVSIVDDVLVTGRSRQEHDQNLRAVLKRAREKGVIFNEDKLEVAVTEVQYFGHVLSSEGLKPDPAKVAAINDMSPPSNKGELNTYMGMVNYLSKFAPRLSEITGSLRELQKKDVVFSWQKSQQQAFDSVKELLTKPGLVLGIYDFRKPLNCSANRQFKGRPRSNPSAGRETDCFCKQITYIQSKELRHDRIRMFRNPLWSKTVSPMCLWQTCYRGNRSFVTSFYIQKATTQCTCSFAKNAYANAAV